MRPNLEGQIGVGFCRSLPFGQIELSRCASLAAAPRPQAPRSVERVGISYLLREETMYIIRPEDRHPAAFPHQGQTRLDGNAGRIRGRGQETRAQGECAQTRNSQDLYADKIKRILHSGCAGRALV